MIQRQQSLWLLLSAICAFLSYKLPFFSGTKEGIKNLTEKAILDGGSTFFLLVVTGICLVLSLITIFLYKDRKLQLKLCIAGVILSVLLLIIYFNELRKLSGSISLSAVFVFGILISYIMAARGIWKDEKLIKSLDKLR
jgi:magnesium-transporting ATPase (P-type)